jgi:hypothetical protein
MDSADKATNKAMSAAYKYAAMQAFCIPTSGDNDADATSHEVAPRRQAPAAHAPARRTTAKPAPPLKQQSSASQATTNPQQAAQLQQQAAGAAQPTTAATAYLRCQQAGLTEAGMRAMATGISGGATAAIAGLSEATQHKLATTGVPQEWVQKYNAAGAAQTDDDPDLPRTWDSLATA